MFLLFLNSMAFLFLFPILLSFLALVSAKVTRFYSDTASDGSASITYTPSNVLNGVDAGCVRNAFQTECENFWWVDGRTHYTFGDKTSFKFSFKGSSASFYGDKFNYGAAAYYTVDGGSSQRFTSETSDSVVTTGLLLSVTSLDPANSHTITVTYDSTSFGPGDGRRWFSLEHILYEVPDEPPEEPSTEVVPKTTASPRPAQTSARGDDPTSTATLVTEITIVTTQSPSSIPSTTTGTEIPPPLPTTAVPQSNNEETQQQSPNESVGASSDGPNVGAIVGAVIGGIIALAIFALIFFCVRRRVKENEYDTEKPSPAPSFTESHTGTITPFVQSSVSSDTLSPSSPVYSDMSGSHFRLSDTEEAPSMQVSGMSFPPEPRRTAPSKFRESGYSRTIMHELAPPPYATAPSQYPNL